jgi:multiple RNA-binding domain-containing protein 1
VCCHYNRSAFRGLAYKKYQHVPLYLEWAPKNIWEGDPAAAAAAAAKRKAATSQLPQAPATAAAAAGVAGAAADAGVEAEDGEQGATEQLNSCIYVKNLNFGTTDAAFKKHFDKAVSAAGGTIHAAKVRLLWRT